MHNILLQVLVALQIWVSPGGSDRNPGTADQPMATVGAALRHARELRRISMVKEGIHIMVKGGVYPLEDPLFIRPEDSGTDESPTIIEAAPGERPVLSGGLPIQGWRKVTDPPKGLPAAAAAQVWEADAPRPEERPLLFRQLWVNGIKAVRARETNGDDEMNRIIAVDKGKGELRIPLPPGGLPEDAGQMEMTIHQMWAIAVLRIKTIRDSGDEAILTFREPEGHIEFEHPWPAPVIDKGHKLNGNSAFFLSNALCFLDRPGEWYEDYGSGKVYYWPRPGEDMSRADVTVPALETLVRIEGTADRPVSHVALKGLTFSYATWLRPSEQGHVPLQAGMYLLDAYKLRPPGTPGKKGLENQAWIGRPPAAVSVRYANHTEFSGCRFEHLASTGLDYERGTRDDTVEGNVFTDIGGTGTQVGVYADPGFETHLPYNPSDLREVCTSEVIDNNLVDGIGNEDWGCVGISAGYVRAINITHNEVRNVPYSGICVGWGWTKDPNCMRDNRITDNYVHRYATHMYDVGGIYTLSAQPGSLITGNRIDSIVHPPYAHDPEHWFYFYFDEGSSYITVKDNWCPAPRFMKNSNGPGNVWENDGPDVSDAIKNGAGLEPAWRSLEAGLQPARRPDAGGQGPDAAGR
jgi:hypothetical protein